MKTIVWCREDLRLFDNQALCTAAEQGEVLPVFIYPEGLGGASYWWLHHSLDRFSASLKKAGASLILKTDKPEQALLTLAQQTSADQVVWNRVYSPEGIAQGLRVNEVLNQHKILAKSYNSQLLIEPTQVLNKQGSPFKVFTPFWRHCLSMLQPSDLVAEPKLTSFEETVESESLDSWGLLPTGSDWAGGLVERWSPGEQGAQKRWQHFLESVISNYKDGRDFPNQANTSYLSPHLAFGEISPKQIWFDTQQALAENDVDATNANKFLTEIGWREYSRYLLVHFPSMLDQPFNATFSKFPWNDDDKLLNLWKKGQTGYPIVDAGMRELWHTGYMHNRVRMVAASFLTKHCLIHWKHGFDWFWDTLVDADIANNTASWQWVSGCGADAAPYFRIFNPILQGEKFDRQGDYVKQWVPELAKLPAKLIHKPWQAGQLTLQQANIVLGKTYPLPIVDHKQARNKALAAYKSIKGLSDSKFC